MKVISNAEHLAAHGWWECRMAPPLGKAIWQLLIKLNRLVSYVSAIPLLDISPSEMKTMFTQKPACEC